MPILIPIDHGNDSIKTKHHRFRSGIAVHKVRPPMTDEILDYGGEFYTLSTERIPYLRDKTVDQRFFMLTLFAIARELLTMEAYEPVVEVDLAVGLPPEHYGTLKDTFEGYFKRGNVTFVYKGMPFSVTIRHVVVCPQAYAAVLAMDKEPGELPRIGELPRVFIIDGGGYTFDIGLLQYGKPEMKFNRSLEEGTIIMYNEVSRLVNARHNMLLGEDRILSVLQGDDPRLKEEVADTIKVAAFEHASDVLNKLREIKVDLRSNPSVFMGGAAKLFQPVFEKSDMVLDARFNLDPKCNVDGFEIMARNRIHKLSA